MSAPHSEAIGTSESSITPQRLSRFGIEVDEALRAGVPDFWESPMPEKQMKDLSSTESLLGHGTS